MDNLPNELLREILLHVFDVPNEMFRDVSGISPFWRPSHVSTSFILGVCKRWMNVATPLLYHVVILRSKAQVYALERTLRKKKWLGSYIKSLRVEGGYGAAMRTIITSAPNIVQLCLSLSIRSSDSVKGLCSSLSLINPSCLVIPAAPEARSNAPLMRLLTKLNVCFRSWTNLVSQSRRLSRVIDNQWS